MVCLLEVNYKILILQNALKYINSHIHLRAFYADLSQNMFYNLSQILKNETKTHFQ